MPGMNRRAIPVALEPLVLEKAAHGMAGREIAEWLEKEHKVKTSYRSVLRFIERTRADRAAIAGAVVREELSKTVLSDLDRVEHIRSKVAQKADALDEGAAVTPEWVREWRGLKALEVKILQLKMNLSGASTDLPQGEPTPRDAARVMAKLFSEDLTPKTASANVDDGEGKGGV